MQYMKYINLKFKSGLNDFIINNFFIWAVIGIILGGRLGYVIFYNLSYYANEKTIQNDDSLKN